jgi:hypothetical protein
MNKGELWKRGIFLCGSSMREIWRVGSFTGDPEGYAEYGSGNGRLFP